MINYKKIALFLLMGTAMILVSGCSKEKTEEYIAVYDYTKYDTPYIYEEVSSSNEVFSNNDEDVIIYFEKMERDLDETDDVTFKDKAKRVFVTAIDFLFYDEEINGVKLSDISDASKEKIINITQRIDNKIEQKWPDYKEVISDKSQKSYNFISGKIKQGLSKANDYIEDKIGENNYQGIKDSGKEFYDTTKDVTVKGFKKIKKWYEGIR